MKKLEMARLGSMSVAAVAALCVTLGVGQAAKGGAAPSRAVEAKTGAVFVPAGPFTMGNAPGAGNLDEVPAHRPRLAAFHIDRTEVTNVAYARCVAADTCAAPSKLGSKTRARYHGEAAFAGHPVVHVSWQQAASYCRWVGGRLPTEAEWEKAARGAKDARRYPWGDDKPTCRTANFAGARGCGGDTDRADARPAGATPYGALNMAGNVWEWVSDWYDPTYYRRSPARDPQGPSWGAFKVMRGGCFDTGAEGLRASCRNRDFPTAQKPNVGFRCARPAR